jgi:hypothetical protein
VSRVREFFGPRAATWDARFPDDIRAADNVRAAFESSGWHALEVDDGDARYLALACRA